MKLGFRNGHPDWSNLGQGQPGSRSHRGSANSPLVDNPGASRPRLRARSGASTELREAVAEHYNRLYRVGSDSKYKKENVSIASGGRLILSRIFAALGEVPLGYQVPDYPAYEDMLDYHSYRVKPVAVPTTPTDDFVISSERLGKVMISEKAPGLPLQQPVQPDGAVDQGCRPEGVLDGGSQTQVHPHPRRVLLALHLRRLRGAGGRARLGGPVRSQRRERFCPVGGRAHQELPVSRLADRLGGGTVGHHREHHPGWQRHRWWTEPPGPASRHQGSRAGESRPGD